MFFSDEVISSFKNVPVRINSHLLGGFLIKQFNDGVAKPDIIRERDDAILEQKGFNSPFYIYVFKGTKIYAFSSLSRIHVCLPNCSGHDSLNWWRGCGAPDTTFSTTSLTSFLCHYPLSQCWMHLLYSLEPDSRGDIWLSIWFHLLSMLDFLAVLCSPYVNLLFIIPISSQQLKTLFWSVNHFKLSDFTAWVSPEAACMKCCELNELPICMPSTFLCSLH